MNLAVAAALPPGLLANGFVNPLLLGGLGLALAPIIIHLLSRRRYRRIDWGATQFLLEAEKENRRRVRFEQWLLLALRCLAMILLATLLARPFLKPGMVAQLLGGGGQVERVIVIDDSASLGYRNGNAAELDQLKAACGRLVEWLVQEAAGDALTVFVTSRPAEPLIARERLAPGMVAPLRQQLEAHKVANTRAQPRAVLSGLAERIVAAGAAARTDLYLLADFQRTDWLAQDATGQTPLRPLQDAVTQHKADLRVVLIAAGQAARENVALVDVQIERPQVLAGLPAIVQTDVANYTGRTLRDAALRVEVDGAAQPAVPLDEVAAGAVKRVSFEATFPDAGFCALTIGVGPLDAFATDDTRRLVQQVKPALNVLIVSAPSGAAPAADGTRLLRSALAPPGPFSSGVTIETVDPSELEGARLGGFDCVLLCNVGVLSAAAADALTLFVGNGGGAAVFAGGEVQPDDYNRLLYADGAGILPAALDQLVGEGGRGAGVGLVRTAAHPLTAMFPAGGESLSEYTRFRTYYRVLEAPAAATSQPGDRAGAVVLARFADAEQTPALLERAYGAGRVLLFTSSVDLEWNNWAQASDGSYVVTLLELVQYLARRGNYPRALLAGETLAVTLPADEFEPSASFQSPAFPEEPAWPAAVRTSGGALGERVTFEGPPATKLGYFAVELRPRDGAAETRPLAVNLDPAESDLAAATAAELDAALAGVPHEYIGAADRFLSGDREARRELWRTLLLTLVAVLMGEQLLAWWFGAAERGQWSARRGVSAR